MSAAPAPRAPGSVACREDLARFAECSAAGGRQPLAGSRPSRARAPRQRQDADQGTHHDHGRGRGQGGQLTARSRRGRGLLLRLLLRDRRCRRWLGDRHWLRLRLRLRLWLRLRLRLWLRLRLRLWRGRRSDRRQDRGLHHGLVGSRLWLWLRLERRCRLGCRLGRGRGGPLRFRCRLGCRGHLRLLLAAEQRRQLQGRTCVRGVLVGHERQSATTVGASRACSPRWVETVAPRVRRAAWTSVTRCQDVDGASRWRRARDAHRAFAELHGDHADEDERAAGELDGTGESASSSHAHPTLASTSSRATKEPSRDPSRRVAATPLE